MDVGFEETIDDGASDFHVPLNKLHRINLSQEAMEETDGDIATTATPGKAIPEEQTTPSGNNMSHTHITSSAQSRADDEPQSESSQQEQPFTDMWQVTDAGGYGFNYGDDDGHDLFGGLVAMMAGGRVPRPVPLQDGKPVHAKPQDLILPAGFKLRLISIREHIPCDKCQDPILPRSLILTHEGLLCHKCANGLPRLNGCAVCRQSTTRYKQSPVGFICL